MAKKNVLTDKEAKRGAQQLFRNRAEYKFETLQGLVYKGKVVPGESLKTDLKELRDLFECSDAGPARFLEVSDLLTALKIHTDLHGDKSIASRIVPELQKAADVFMKLAATS